MVFVWTIVGLWWTWSVGAPYRPSSLAAWEEEWATPARPNPRNKPDLPWAHPLDASEEAEEEEAVVEEAVLTIVEVVTPIVLLEVVPNVALAAQGIPLVEEEEE